MTAQTLQISETQFKVYRRLFRDLLFSHGHTIWPGYDIEIVLNNYIEKNEAEIFAEDDKWLNEKCTDFKSGLSTKEPVKTATTYALFLYCKSKKEFLNNYHEKAISSISEALYYLGYSCGLLSSTPEICLNAAFRSDYTLSSDDPTVINERKIKNEIIIFLRENIHSYHWQTYKDAYNDILKMLINNAPKSGFTFTPQTPVNVTDWGNPKRPDRDSKFLAQLSEIFSSSK